MVLSIQLLPRPAFVTYRADNLAGHMHILLVWFTDVQNTLKQTREMSEVKTWLHPTVTFSCLISDIQNSEKCSSFWLILYSQQQVAEHIFIWQIFLSNSQGIHVSPTGECFACGGKCIAHKTIKLKLNINNIHNGVRQRVVLSNVILIFSISHLLRSHKELHTQKQ